MMCGMINLNLKIDGTWDLNFTFKVLEDLRLQFELTAAHIFWLLFSLWRLRFRLFLVKTEVTVFIHNHLILMDTRLWELCRDTERQR